MQLHYTPRSHFARKVRLLLAGLQVDVDLIDAGNAAEADPARFGGNPLMKVPTLVDGQQWVVESDHIAAYLVRKLDPADRFDVLTTDVDALNVRAVLNGVMSAEAELILAERTGLDTRAHRRFDKMRAGIDHGLAWLEDNHSLIPTAPSYLTFHAIAMWDHLALYGMCERDCPRLRERISPCADIDFVAASKPL